MIRIATDVGGTFTDLAAYDSETGEFIIAKASTTPEVVNGVSDVMHKARVDAAKADYFIHGSTIAINTVIEKKGVVTGLITTRGFRDVLEIARGNIVNSFDLLFTTPPPLVPRRLRLEIDERIRADGSILRPLDEAEVKARVRDLMGQGVKAIAVCLLHAYANPVHEKRVAALVREVCGEAIFVSVSSDILREYREFERTSTAVLNAYVGPRVGAYLHSLQGRLAETGFRGSAMVMQSNGGTMAFELAKVQPVRTMESGPVGGTVAAAHLAAKAGYRNVVAFDMGGTTAKVSLVRDGNFEISEGYWIGGEEHGYALQLPVVDVVEIGAGGGSIARVDEMGSLKIGPTSAGAVPGPACYGKGGNLATVSDADLLLGRLNPDYFLGGELTLSPQKSFEVIAAQVAQPLGLEVMRAAFGIIKIADTHMAHAVRLMTVEKGHDPRDFVLVAYGGAGPCHAVAVARELNIGTVVIPANSGILSAVGMLLTDAKEEFVLSRICALDVAVPAELELLFQELETDGFRRMQSAGFGSSDIYTRRAVELRYTGQEFTLRMPVTEPTSSEGFLGNLRKRFSELHELRYGHAFDKATLEIVALRAEVCGRLEKPKLDMGPHSTGKVAAPEYDNRQVYFEGCGKVPCRVYRRDRLALGSHITGPAIVEDMASTTVLHPGDTGVVDSHGSLIITVAPEAPNTAAEHGEILAVTT